MTITIQDSSLDQLDKILSILSAHGIGVEKVELAGRPKPTISWTKNGENLSAFFGIWKDTPRTIEILRGKAWRNTDCGHSNCI